ncbi:MAG TPA: dipeptide epimerase [Steroidobacteraceae bacterium]|jgi:L-alanine-DL-glutamate epimerase-like enolase superfamily enzyme|nr:dipeptide epimerase [Steroidobacteraceae bacterium]
MADHRLALHIGTEQWPLRVPFRITGHTIVNLDVVVVTVERDGLCGRGEAAGVDYRGDDLPTMYAQLEGARPRIEAGLTRQDVQGLLGPGGARNALDCALWELEARQARSPVWQLAGLAEPRPLLSTYTIGADSPAAMAVRAVEFASARAIKLKLIGDPDDAARVRAVRAARPEVWLAVDANQGFTRAHLDALLPTLQECAVALIEQPFPVGQEPTLEQLSSPIPIAADEAAQVSEDLPRLVGRFHAVNIKLDKCGGLTEGLRMAASARRLGLEVMIGNMVGTSLAMAPAYLVGQSCQIVDLDGPLLLASDRPECVNYEHGYLHCDERVWGYA